MTKKIISKDLCKMSQEERSKTIAEDVIAQILSKTYLIEAGSYIKVWGDKADETLNQELGASCPISPSYLQQTQCTVCAKGAIFMSSMLRDKKLTRGSLDIFDIRTRSDMTEQYQAIRSQNLDECQLFDPRTYDLIEIAFEGNVIADARSAVGRYDHPLHAEFMEFKLEDEETGDYDADLDRCRHGSNTFIGRVIANFEDFFDAEERLLAIMFSIASNGGVFDGLRTVTNDDIQKLRTDYAISRKRREAGAKAAQTRRTNKLMLEIAKADRKARQTTKKKSKKGKRK